MIVLGETSLEETLRIYVDKYYKLFYENKILNSQFIEVVEKKNELIEKLTSIEVFHKPKFRNLNNPEEVISRENADMLLKSGDSSNVRSKSAESFMDLKGLSLNM